MVKRLNILQLSLNPDHDIKLVLVLKTLDMLGVSIYKFMSRTEDAQLPPSLERKVRRKMNKNAYKNASYADAVN